MFFIVWHSPAKSSMRTHPMMCGSTVGVLRMLDNKFREKTIGGGLSMDNNQVTLFSSHNAGNKQTWTILITYPTGLSCILDSGEDWFVNQTIVKGAPT